VNPAEWIACGRKIVEIDGPPRVMGIVNATPDSFSDGGRAFALDDALALAIRHAADGADILDVGGESSRPGAEAVELQEELRRVVPVIESIRANLATPISVDTTKAEVARRAIAAGATIVNDITSLGDPEMAEVVASSGAGLVLMHMAGTPQTMQIDPTYGDIVAEVYEYLARRIEHAESRGIARASIAVDPGIGFGKRSSHNLSLLRHLDKFATLGCVVLVGTSRKGFLGKLTGRPTAELAAATVASCLWAFGRGATVARVHDVGPMVDAARVWAAIRGDGIDG